MGINQRSQCRIHTILRNNFSDEYDSSDGGRNRWLFNLLRNRNDQRIILTWEYMGNTRSNRQYHCKHRSVHDLNIQWSDHSWNRDISHEYLWKWRNIREHDW